MRLVLWLVLVWLPVLAAAAVPDFATVRAHHRTTEGRLVDRAGEPLAERPVDGATRRLEWVPLEALSPAMLETLLEAEDRRFYEHGGIDWRAFAAAAIQNLWYEHPRGASTLSMQLVGLLDPALHPERNHGGRRTLEQKWDQAVAAQEIEARWSKAEILEAYLNLAPFRGALQGIHAAAWALVGKAPDALDRAEASILAALLRAPNAPPPKVAWRACELLRRIGSADLCPRVHQLAAHLDPVRLAPRWNDAPHLARRLVTEPGVVHTVLDADWQRGMERALEAAAPARAAAVVIDNATGAVLADVGGLDAAQPDAAVARHPAGSMSWPVMTALALDTKTVNAATLFPVPATGDAMSVRAALATGAMPEALAAHVPGAREATLLELLRAPGAAAPDLSRVAIDLAQLAALGRMLAVDGVWRPPFWRAQAQGAPVAMISPQAAFIARDLFPAVRVAPLPRTHAAWGVGSNGAVTIAVWMETGATASVETRAWLNARLAASGRWPPERVVPTGVVSAPVRFDNGREPPRSEWFIKGTATAVAAPPVLIARIVTPSPRAIVAAADLDAAGGVWLEASREDERLRWQVDGVPAGQGGRVLWRPSPGLHHIVLLDTVGRVIDTVDVAVRSDVSADARRR
ncbi:penicillin-binding protein [Nitrogeniibacter mangrovi]|uniref:peptidoglycan glycosyltransferase n=1 Tax=Nitrogeniibacter mangrovi TaxID=2016596 RepID=A0A6C1B0S0_9RHOO|nr:transglycosylase domain-containing protein [Nitrogeniibacter mangrovi]QID16495.1 penicillin-binding protein [Nitrogeniibacter mangrovi]